MYTLAKMQYSSLMALYILTGSTNVNMQPTIFKVEHPPVITKGHWKT